MEKSLATMFIIMLALVSSFIGDASPTHAQSFNPRAEVGRWQDIYPRPSLPEAISRIYIDSTCPYVPYKVTSTYCPYPREYYVHYFATCSYSSACDWGRVRAIYDSNGWLRATYNQGFALKHVWIRVYEDGGQELLRVYIWTDFTDEDGREDFSTDQWFQRT